jgi:hypothetical protein
MGIKVTELDHRITRAIGFWLEALPEAPKAPASQQPESTNLRGFSKDAGQKLE